jgi:WD repeat and SOF domain-containing protein 1
MWNPPGQIQPQTKSDLLRLLLLHKFGGVWVDTDTILLRDLRPIVEYVGEFGGKFSM